MTKRKIIAILSGTVFGLGLLVGCSQKVEVNNKPNDSTVNSNQNKTDEVDKENITNASGITITEIKVDEDMFANEDHSIDIENTNARYNGFVGNYDVWIPKDSSCVYVSKDGNNNVILKLSFSSDNSVPKNNHVLGAEDYNLFSGVADAGEMYYVNNDNKLVIIDLNGEIPKFNIVDLDFSVNYISGCFVFVDGAVHREIYVVSTEGELYRINYVDSKQDGSGIYKLDGYGNVKFSDILKDKDPSTVSVLIDYEKYDSPSLIIRQINDQQKVDTTAIDVEYDEYYSEVSLSLK